MNQVAGVWHGKGKALVALGREEEVLAAYEQAIQLYPDNAYLWQYKGSALQDLGRHLEALSAFEQAIQLGPDDADN